MEKIGRNRVATRCPSADGPTTSSLPIGRSSKARWLTPIGPRAGLVRLLDQPTLRERPDRRARDATRLIPLYVREGATVPVGPVVNMPRSGPMRGTSSGFILRKPQFRDVRGRQRNLRLRTGPVGAVRSSACRAPLVNLWWAIDISTAASRFANRPVFFEAYRSTPTRPSSIPPPASSIADSAATARCRTRSGCKAEGFAQVPGGSEFVTLPAQPEPVRDLRDTTSSHPIQRTMI